MNRRDKAAWAACATLADVGECVCGWITGTIEQTPGYSGGPHEETTEHARLLCAVNRAGLVTVQMDAEAWDGCCGYAAMAEGLITLGRLHKLASVSQRWGVQVGDLRRRDKRRVLGEWAGAVQDSALAEMQRARLVRAWVPPYAEGSALWHALRDFAHPHGGQRCRGCRVCRGSRALSPNANLGGDSLTWRP